MASEHAKGDDPTNSPNIREDSLANRTTPANTKSKHPLRRRSRALSADYSLELALLTRKVKANLSHLKHTAKLSTQPLATLQQRRTDTNPVAPKNSKPIPTSPHDKGATRHAGLADQLRKALNDSRITPPHTLSTEKCEKVVIHESSYHEPLQCVGG